MGLESGWNCHISLYSQADLSTAPFGMYDRKRVTKKFSADSDKKTLTVLCWWGRRAKDGGVLGR